MLLTHLDHVNLFTLKNNGYLENQQFSKKINSEWEYKNYYHYTLIVVNKKFSLATLLSPNNFSPSGMLLPMKSKVLLALGKKENHYLTTSHPTLSGVFKHYQSLKDTSTPYHLHFRLTENHQIADNNSQEILLDKEFDSLYIRNGYIIGTKNHQTSIFNQDLENITPKNFRALYFRSKKPGYDYSFPQILAKNTIFWLTHKGKLIEEYPEEKDCEYNSGWSADTDFIMINEKDGQFMLHNVLLSENNIYEDAWFLNKKKILDSSRLYGINLYENYLIVKKEGKYGLLKYEFDKRKKNVQLQTVLSIKYEFIYPMLFNADQQAMIVENDGKFGLLSLYSESNLSKEIIIEDSLSLPIEYDDIKFLNKCQPFLLKANNLFDFSEIREIPKYAKLEPFIWNFARYILPSGKKGWLDKKGNEYPDIDIE